MYQHRGRWTIPSHEIEMKEFVGQGGFGKVYRGYWKGTDVAIKMMSGDCDSKELISEANVMKRLHHPHVVHFYGLVCSPSVWIVMEYLSGGCLQNVLKTKKSNLSPSHLLKFCSEVCNGMEYLHSNNIIHRDLAARNCLVDNDLTVKVADFGLTRYVPDDNYFQSTYGIFALRWAAPEVYDRRYTKKADVWSFGILMWEIFTFGKTPYGNLPDHQVASYVTRGNILGKPECCSKEVYEVMKRCWNYDKDSRPSFTNLSTLLALTPAPQETADLSIGGAIALGVAAVGAISLLSYALTSSNSRRQ